MFFLHQAHGTPASLDAVLSKAVQQCPKSELLWLFFAREKWKGQGNADEARKILQEAFAHNPQSERIWLAAVRLGDAGQQAIIEFVGVRDRVKSRKRTAPVVEAAAK